MGSNSNLVNDSVNYSATRVAGVAQSTRAPRAASIPRFETCVRGTTAPLAAERGRSTVL